jgi:KDO2-lipid IV(A) lauroyltransferase
MLARLGLAAMWLLHFLPLALLAHAGRALGMLLYAFGFERRRVCLLNLARCLPELAPTERSALARRHFRAVGRSLLDRGILWWAPRERILRMVRLAGSEHLRALKGQPVILLAPHFVALDVGFARLACEGDLASIYANQKSAVMNRMLLAGRTRFGMQRLFSRQEGVRPALAALKEGIPFYYLPDQDYGPRDAIFVPFFGVPAATITGLSRLARLAGASVLPCVTRMLPGREGYEITCYPAWPDFPTDDVAADTRRMSAFVEERVREMPEQYFWTHKRFKTRPAGEAKWY